MKTACLHSMDADTSTNVAYYLYLKLIRRINFDTCSKPGKDQESSAAAMPGSIDGMKQFRQPCYIVTLHQSLINSVVTFKRRTNFTNNIRLTVFLLYV